MNNANLDKSEGNRKSLAELRSELKKWEEERMEPKRVVEDTAAHEVSSFVLSWRISLEKNSVGSVPRRLQTTC